MQNDELKELVDAILNSGVAADIDAGCDGYGPIANAMVKLGHSRLDANQQIFAGLDDDSLTFDFDEDEEDDE